MSLQDVFESLKGGRGRGNWGHAGIPGKRGGSAPNMGDNSAKNIPTSVKGNLIDKIKRGLPAPSVGELKVSSWDPEAGYRSKAKTYAIVTMEGQASSSSKDDLKSFADSYNIDLSDKTYNK